MVRSTDLCDEPKFGGFSMRSQLRFLFLFGCFFLLFTGLAQAAITFTNGKWETTFDCAEWFWNAPGTCDGLAMNATTPETSAPYWPTNVTQIVSSANNPLGTGRGMRKWTKDVIGETGWNNSMSAALKIYFPSPQKELWIRWYMRYEAGYKWATYGYDKHMYIRTAGATSIVPEYVGSNGYRLAAQAAPVQEPMRNNSAGWQSVMGGATSDGQFHCFEVHVKNDTDGSANGVGHLWIDGVLKSSNLAVAWSNGGAKEIAGWTEILFDGNQSLSGNNKEAFVDWDDMVIYNTTPPNKDAQGNPFIGPIASNDVVPAPLPPTSPPPPPTNQPPAFNASPISKSTATIGVAYTGQTLASSATDPEGDSITYSKVSGPVWLSVASNGDLSGTPTTAASDSFVVRATSNGGTADATLNITALALLSSEPSIPVTTLFEEKFEDSNLSGRGWYDNTTPVLSTLQAIPGSTKSLEFRFPTSATKPTAGGAMRKKFTDSEAVYVSYYVKYSSNWEGSNRVYHPHEFYLLTNKDGDWSGLANTHLTAYIEQNEGTPLVAIQDGLNIDQNRINQNLTAITEARGVAGCNGDSDGLGSGTCYLSGTSYLNGKDLRADKVYFADAVGPYYKNDWHRVEAYLKLNSIVNGKGIADGVIQYWFDGQLIIDHQDVMLRTAQYPDMKFNQLVIAPWIGDGSPVDQTFWIDNLTIAYKISPPKGLMLKGMTP